MTSTRFMQKLDTAKRVYAEEGLMELTRSVYHDLPVNSKPIYQDIKSENSLERWSLIERHLSEDDSFLLDIGCNAGLFVKLAADEGLVALGVDRYQDRYRNAVERSSTFLREQRNVGFINATVTPANVERFPTDDVVLLLSVYHHWYKEFGKEGAESVLESLNGANKIFFEPPSKRSLYVSDDDTCTPEPPIEDHNLASIVEYNTTFLESIFTDGYEVEHIGNTTVEDGGRCLFVVKKQDGDQ